MLKVELSFLIILSAFFVILIFRTQKIYSSDHFTTLLIFATLFPVVLIFLNLDLTREDLLKLIAGSSIFLVYYLLLLLLKKQYKKLNTFLISKKLINGRYADKDFTFVHRQSGTGSVYWDEELTTKPSWLDGLLTFLLFALPMLSMVIIFDILSLLFD